MTSISRERADLIESLDRHRGFLLHTVSRLGDEQARQQSSPPSELSLGGLIKHVSATEAQWADFAEHGADEGAAITEFDEAAIQAHREQFTLSAAETLPDVLARYAEVARRTDELVRTLDLDQAHPLPAAPWFEPGASWTNRRTFLHIIAETSQHAGHADLLREAIDGQKTMG